MAGPKDDRNKTNSVCHFVERYKKEKRAKSDKKQVMEIIKKVISEQANKKVIKIIKKFPKQFVCKGPIYLFP